VKPTTIAPDLSYINDIKQVHGEEVINKVQEHTRFSSSFIVLLVASSVICTLGLLLNTAPIIIGGMIISPLMWPLMKISLGITYGRSLFLRRAVVVLVISVSISFISAMIITFFSPVKLINSEILSRTVPTLLDLIVAIAAGTVAALAIIRPRISESLAGVAIATSLTPPLCVSAIGLALFDLQIFTGGYILFLANVVSILFISSMIFLFTGAKSHRRSLLRRQGIVFLAVLLISLTIPLFYFLQNYSFKAVDYRIVQKILTSHLKEISPSSRVREIKTDISTKEKKALYVEAVVFLPGETTISYDQQQAIARDLEIQLKKPIDLQLFLQRSISIASETDVKDQSLKKMLSESFGSSLSEISSTFTIDSIQIETSNKKKNIPMHVILRGDLGQGISEQQRLKLETELTRKAKGKVSLSIEILTRTMLQGNPITTGEKIERTVRSLLEDTSSDFDIGPITIQQGSSNKDKTYNVLVDIRATSTRSITRENFTFLKEELEKKHSAKFNIRVIYTEKQEIIF